MMKVEICANSFESAKAAQEGGASRIELCTELSVGGLTPSHGLIQRVMEELSLEVHVLIRPRSADFTYSKEEVAVMIKDIEFCKSMGCHGIVTGGLTTDQTIDMQVTGELIKASQGMHFTYHRAFDWTPDYQAAFEQLQQLGIQRLLSSGQGYIALQGIEVLKQLQQMTADIEVMPGGGVRFENAIIFKNAGFSSIHLSATETTQRLKQPPKISMQNPGLFVEGTVATSDPDLIRAVVDMVS